ncbi:bifunctional hydroxymethylpyrimidine kinase/phosphomethylpyrimidine kinase [Saccharibacillus sp. JS10]|nr:bifunctional hydroxymethylpyrimidine kinase/phosphomethylpyrimidine kinase [Saccharibacillus sp. JS10]MCQ4086588.1 bifunctional hydroxymethylpyrimidine kinase/phosphomethylpyrimidine kinase [Saccharibacillus sp. JS10]
MIFPRALTIAGSDSGGGAGIQADLKTFQELDVFGMSAITAVTAQNTTGVSGVYPMSPEAVKAQIDAVGSDLGVDALKTGMLFDAAIIAAVSERITAWGWRNVVVDPVMIAKGGANLLQRDAIQALIADLLPLAAVVTPNIPEAEALTGIKITTMQDRRIAAERIMEFGAKAVVIKGGHAEGNVVVDLFYNGKEFEEMSGIRIATRHTHGTGCTYSAAITAKLATGATLSEAVHTARDFIQAAIEESSTLNLGKGHGPTCHWAYRRRVGV